MKRYADLDDAAKKQGLLLALRFGPIVLAISTCPVRDRSIGPRLPLDSNITFALQSAFREDAGLEPVIDFSLNKP
jgi:hypothetical protein